MAELLSFTADDPLATNSNTVHYTVTFSGAVNGVDVSQFSLVSSGVLGASIASVTEVLGSAGTAFSIAVNTGTGEGTVELDYIGANVTDLAGNHLGGGQFTPAVSYPVGGTVFLRSADFDGDGQVDLLTGSNSGAFSLLRGNGDGTFQTPTMFSAGENIVGFDVGDLNGDGKADVVGSDYTGNGNISVSLGNGDGTFQAPAYYLSSSLGYTSRVVIADLDGDGKSDVAVTNNNGFGGVSVLLGNGDGTLQPMTNFAAGLSPSGLAVGDMNGDDILDLAVTSYFDGKVSILFGNGDGTFQPRTILQAGAGPENAVLADMDSDGDLDLGVVNFGVPEVSLFINNGNGSFLPRTTYAIGGGAFDLSSGDVNGDGKIDLVVADYGTNAASVLLGNGDGTLQSRQVLATETNPSGVLLLDLNGDGHLDISTANSGSNTVSILLNSLSTVTGEVYTINNAAPVANADAFTGDLDQAEIAFNNGLRVYLNDGSGAFAGSGQSFANSSGLAIAAGDLNGDGYADIVTGSPNGSTQQIFLNDGTGNFAATNQSLGINAAVRVVLGDVNGDGSLDIVADGTASQIWLNNGSGIFTASDHSIGSFPSVAVGDVDGDGSLDLVTGSGHVFYNDGTGSFTDSGQVLNPGVAAVELCDLDGDHDLDLVQANWIGSNRVYLNNGSGVFADTGQALSAGYTYDIALGDVNDDGFADLVSVAYFGGGARVLLNDGTGHFVDSGQVLNVSGDGSIGASLGDVDGDGDLDLAMAFELGPNRVFLNDGAGNFSNSLQSLGNFIGTRDVVLVDFDNDGYSEDRVTVLRVLDNDGDADAGDILSVNAVDGTSALGAALSISGNGREVIYDPTQASQLQALATGQVDTDTFTYTASDGHGGFSTTSVTITIAGANDAPTLAAATLDATEDGALVDLDLATLGDDIDNDDDGTTLTYAITSAAEGANVSISGTTLSFDPGNAFQDLAQGQTRDLLVVVSATDSHGASLSNNVVLTVSGVNDAPTLAAGSLVAVEDGQQVTLDLAALGDDLDGDDDGATLTYAITDLPLAGSATISGTTLSFDPGTAFQDLAEGQFREVLVGISATDSHGETVSGAVTVTISGVNDAPAGGADTANIDRDTVLTLSAAALLSNDDDVDTAHEDLVIGAVADGANGTVQLNPDGSVTFTPAEGFFGVATFTYQVFDGVELSDPVEVAVNVTKVVGVSLIGNSSANTLAGGAGDDTISGLGGNDRLSGNGGYDIITGGTGNDTLDGGAGSDSFLYGTGSNGFDVINGGAGSFDRIAATAAGVTIGIDSLTGIEEFDAAGFANVKILGTSLANLLDFSSIALTGISQIDAAAGNDTVIGSDGADVIIAGSGNDILSGGDGADLFMVGAASGTDVFDGGSDVDRIEALANNVSLSLTGSNVSGIETISAGAFTGFKLAGTSAGNLLDFSGVSLIGISQIDAAAGNDTVVGSGGADVIIAGSGNDLLSGGDGADLFMVGASSGTDVYDGGSGVDRIEALANNVSLTVNGSNINGMETISAGAFTGFKLVGTSAADLLDFNSMTLTGISQIDSGSGNDTVTGSAGADFITGGSGADRLTGGAGVDTFDFNLAGESRGASVDTIVDFQHGIDRIDLSTIDANTPLAGNQDFIFIGTAAFTHVSGQLRIDTTTPGQTHILGDTDGNGTVDFDIRLTGVINLAASDFVL